MNFDHCVAYSFGKPLYGEAAKIDSNITPGPGNYFPTNYTLKNPPGFKMGTGERGFDLKLKTPGVGEYALPTSVPSGPMYSMKGPTGGEEMWKKNCSPGPAQYQPRFHNGAPSYSLGSRPDTLYNKNPGVGNYNVTTSKSLNVPSYIFGSEPKGDKSNMNNPNNSRAKWTDGDPGPGNYNPNKNVVIKIQPKFSFGCEPRGNGQGSQTPGPGTYGFKQLFGNEGPNALMSPTSASNNLMFLNDYQTPGPGQYNSSMYNRPNCPGFKMGSSRWNDKLNNKNGKGRSSPGPCDYSADRALNRTLRHAPQWGYGLTEPTNVNPNLLNRTFTPGPGKYNTSENMGRGPKYSLGAKNEPSNKWLKSTPGPGQYNNGILCHLSKNPKWKLGTEPRADDLQAVLKNNYPGPGHYISQGKFTLGHKFNKDERMKSERKWFDGSHFYRIPCSIVDVNNYTRSSGKFDPQFRYV